MLIAEVNAPIPAPLTVSVFVPLPLTSASLLPPGARSQRQLVSGAGTDDGYLGVGVQRQVQGLANLRERGHYRNDGDRAAGARSERAVLTCSV